MVTCERRLHAVPYQCQLELVALHLKRAAADAHLYLVGNLLSVVAFTLEVRRFFLRFSKQ